VPPIYVDYIFSALVTRIRMRIQPAFKVRRVDLRQAQPPEAARYEAHFCAPVRFGAGADRLCMSTAEWESPTGTADAALARLLEEHARILGERVPSALPTFRAEVEEVIATDPQKGGSAPAVARALHVSMRTLQRKLEADGTTFRDVSDSVRRRLAEGYLADPRVSIAEVVFLLGFSDPSSFTRAFRRWTGESPGRWRLRRA
jgi:AraC-like DNA-binding protein